VSPSGEEHVCAVTQGTVVSTEPQSS
jgi:hypothetical protein